MTDFVLVPGAGGIATPYWRLVSDRLRSVGHQAFPVDLPGDAQDAGLPEYANLVATAMRGCSEPVVVAQSLGGFSAVMACDQVSARKLILVNAMVPVPGETPGAWWSETGAVEARIEAAKVGGYSIDFDIATYFLHDLPPDDAAAVLANPGEEADLVFGQPCAVDAWPDVPIAAIVGRDDRMFPVEFQLHQMIERVGVTATVIPGGHLLALANPDGLTDALLRLAA